MSLNRIMLICSCIQLAAIVMEEGLVGLNAVDWVVVGLLAAKVLSALLCRMPVE